MTEREKLIKQLDERFIGEINGPHVSDKEYLFSLEEIADFVLADRKRTNELVPLDESEIVKMLKDYLASKCDVKGTVYYLPKGFTLEGFLYVCNGHSHKNLLAERICAKLGTPPPNDEVLEALKELVSRATYSEEKMSVFIKAREILRRYGK